MRQNIKIQMLTSCFINGYQLFCQNHCCRELLQLKCQSLFKVIVNIQGLTIRFFLFVTKYIFLIVYNDLTCSYLLNLLRFFLSFFFKIKWKKTLRTYLDLGPLLNIFWDNISHICQLNRLNPFYFKSTINNIEKPTSD